jgi:hypothetical protein
MTLFFFNYQLYFENTEKPELIINPRVFQYAFSSSGKCMKIIPKSQDSKSIQDKSKLLNSSHKNEF